MIILKSEDEIKKLREAGKIVYRTHQFIKPYIKPGITTLELNDLIEDYIINKEHSYPSFKNLYGFPKAVCISVNDEVVHGIPDNRALRDGDIVKIDIGASYEGYHGDSAWSYAVGNVDPEVKRLMEKTKEALYEGIKMAKIGNRIGDIGARIQEIAEASNLGIVKELVGHGVGQKVHEDPNVPNYGKKGRGPLIEEGLVIAIEPMLNLGTADIYEEDNGWTIVTRDNKKSAHFEHTIAVTKEGPIIMTGE